MGHTFNRPDEAAMLRILERHPHSPEGAILRLAWLEGLSRSEITELRWDQVDFEGKAIQLPDRTVPLEPSTENCLRERHVRCALRDPHVVISERSVSRSQVGRFMCWLGWLASWLPLSTTVLDRAPAFPPRLKKVALAFFSLRRARMASV